MADFGLLARRLRVHIAALQITKSAAMAKPMASPTDPPPPVLPVLHDHSALVPGPNLLDASEHMLSWLPLKPKRISSSLHAASLLMAMLPPRHGRAGSLAAKLMYTVSDLPLSMIVVAVHLPDCTTNVALSGSLQFGTAAAADCGASARAATAAARDTPLLVLLLAHLLQNIEPAGIANGVLVHAQPLHAKMVNVPPEAHVAPAV